MARPTISYRDIRKKLRKLGFEKKPGGKHEKWKHPDCRLVMLSHGNSDAGPRLIKIIASQAGLSVDEFLAV